MGRRGGVGWQALKQKLTSFAWLNTYSPVGEYQRVLGCTFE